MTRQPTGSGRAANEKRGTSNQKRFSHGGNVHAFARAAGVPTDEVLDFSASINPLGLPGAARLAYRQALQKVVHYPEPYAESLSAALARYHNLDVSEILVGNGSTQLIHLVARLLAPRRVLLMAPLFSEHATAFRATGAAIEHCLLRPPLFALTLERVANRLHAKPCEALVLTNPNSPTGALVERSQLEDLVQLCQKQRTWLIIDETFIDWREEESSKHVAVQNSHVILLRSLTKFFALPGLRVGYAIAHSTLIRRMRSRLEPWSVNTVAQAVGTACVSDQRFIDRSRAVLPRERDWMFAQLQTISELHVFPSRANFFLMRLQTPNLNAAQLAGLLAREKILIRVCDNFVGLGAQDFRVAVRTRAENRRLVQVLRRFLPA